MKRLFLSITIILSSFNFSIPCTTAVVSGKATDDGRPLLLKNRDTDVLQNKLVFFSEGKFKFIGLVNSTDKENKEVWCGYNEAGFAIMNSASYNLKMKDTTKLTDREGIIMKLALETCASLHDFEKMLQSLSKPLGVESNFGVIDAVGGSAYYETNNFTFKKYDVNDPEVAPNGYLIRTNYSVSGEDNKGFGYIRYATANSMFESQLSAGKISFEFLINDVTRCLTHSFTNTDLTNSIPDSDSDKHYVFFRDYIPRYSTSAAIVVQGVKEYESAKQATIWTILGFSLSSVIIPVWLLDDGTLPKILQADESGNAPLCDIALKLKNRIFPLQNDAKENYINLAALMNKNETGVRQKLMPIEEQVLVKTKSYLAKWQEKGVMEKEVKDFYSWVDSLVIPEIKKRFQIGQ